MILAPDDLPRIKQENEGKTIALAFGTFDIVHPGHIKYLDWAKQQADILVVAVTHDEQVAQSKGPSRPIISQKFRAEIVDALKSVDYVALRGPGAPYESAIVVVNKLHPDVLVFGPDWGQSVVDEWKSDFPDLEIVIAPTPTEFSTTNIVSKIKSSS
jgi:D-beta-D-heptose 7-phosphate kinase/D-beta-D-heptose 1-phosphate adenosyltransferase